MHMIYWMSLLTMHRQTDRTDGELESYWKVERHLVPPNEIAEFESDREIKFDEPESEVKDVDQGFTKPWP